MKGETGGAYRISLEKPLPNNSLRIPRGDGRIKLRRKGGG
jgi:hypothetical protein